MRDNVYISFDCDVFDPSLVPATGTPEPGGLTWQQVQTLFKRLCVERNVVGLDVSEFLPIANTHCSEYTIAKLIYRMIGYRFAKCGCSGLTAGAKDWEKYRG